MIIVVTGGSKGIGKAIAKALVQEGNVVIICSTNKKELEKTAKEINAVPIVCDVTN